MSILGIVCTYEIYYTNPNAEKRPVRTSVNAITSYTEWILTWDNAMFKPKRRQQQAARVPQLPSQRWVGSQRGRWTRFGACRFLRVVTVVLGSKDDEGGTGADELAPFTNGEVGVVFGVDDLCSEFASICQGTGREGCGGGIDGDNRRVSLG